MDLKIFDKHFIVGGAGSGLGRAVALVLAAEGAHVLAVARTKEKLETLKHEYPRNIEFLAADITTPETRNQLLNRIEDRALDGIFINAGGPPAKSFIETSEEDWDQAYANILKWKIMMVKALLPKFQKQNYGRILFSESSSVKQPLGHLVLSNSFRLAVIGAAKTLANEIGNQGITVNVIAPGYHDTPALERLFIKKSGTDRISVKEARLIFEKEVPSGKLGSTAHFASLAAWLLSPLSAYINGQTITVDGGLVKGTMG